MHTVAHGATPSDGGPSLLAGSEESDLLHTSGPSADNGVPSACAGNVLAAGHKSVAQEAGTDAVEGSMGPSSEAAACSQTRGARVSEMSVVAAGLSIRSVRSATGPFCVASDSVDDGELGYEDQPRDKVIINLRPVIMIVTALKILFFHRRSCGRRLGSRRSSLNDTHQATCAKIISRDFFVGRCPCLTWRT